MSIVRAYSVFCDSNEAARCRGWVAENTESAAAARREAKAAGWVREGARTEGAARDLCPECAKVAK